MASKTGQPAKVENPEELLEIAEQSMDRLRVMYEQYFLGMQKQAPGVLHSEVERRTRDLQQANLRNTALRYRFATLQQKFASYNAYWRRTLRQIENGTYFRNLSKIGRNAARSGEDVPEEILAAMPKRMREQVMRDRAAAVAVAARRGAGKGNAAAVGGEDELLDLGDAFAAEEAPMQLPPEDLADVVAMINEPSELRRVIKAQRGPHRITEDDGELDIDSFFAAVEAEGPAAAAPARRAGDSGVNFRAVTRSTAPPVERAQPPSQPLAAQLHAQTSPMERSAPTLQTQTSPMERPAAGPPPGPPPVPTRTLQMPPLEKPAPQGRPPGPPPTPPPPPPGTHRTLQMPPLARPSTMGQPPPTPGAPPRAAMGIPHIPAPGPPRPAPAQATRPNPVAPGAAATARPPVPASAQTQPLPLMPRAPAPPRPRSDTQPEPMRAPPVRPSQPAARPPAGMTDADVNALYAKYVKAKEMVGEAAGPGAYGKLLKTINAQAPKIMEQYKAKGVDFQVVVKDNQVIIRAKPKP